MGKYFLTLSVLRGPWDQVFTAFWQRYPNPYSKHVLTEDILHREVTEDQKLLSRRLLTKTNRLPRWAECLFPSNVARSVYILEDSIVDPKNRTMTTFTWNINHARLMVVEERCVYRENPENSCWTEVKREGWVSSSLFGVSRAVQVRGMQICSENKRVLNPPIRLELNASFLLNEDPVRSLITQIFDAKACLLHERSPRYSVFRDASRSSSAWKPPLSSFYHHIVNESQPTSS